MGKRQRRELEDYISFAVLIVGLLFAAFIILAITRIQSGLIGIILALLAGALIVYWVKEAKKITREEFPSKISQKWTCDLIKEKDSIVIVAEVPGPESEVKVSLFGNKLEIKGGNNFVKIIKVGKAKEITNYSYNNGILNIRLRKLSISVGEKDPY
ncbi:MAG: Hsp20/alpha crystallin family protein [Nitrososphaerales archaeon]